VRSTAALLVPFTRGDYLPAICDAVRSTSCLPILRFLDPDDDGAYGKLLTEYWSLGADLIVCEHDNVPTAAQLDELASCGHDWCGFPYRHGERVAERCLGLTKFSLAFRRRLPHVMEGAATIYDDARRPTPWWSLDARLALRLTARGEKWERHDGLVAHRPPISPPNW
jgi:hypothetical protein